MPLLDLTPDELLSTTRAVRRRLDLSCPVEHEVPAHVFACIEGRPEGLAPADLAWFYGSIIQAGWSFQLAARARGLGGVWTTHHLDYEREAAEVLGIPYADVTQVALLPVAYTVGTDFKAAKRNPLETVLHWQSW